MCVQTLNEAANATNLQGEGFAATLSIFDTNNELWTGRIAMLGECRCPHIASAASLHISSSSRAVTAA